MINTSNVENICNHWEVYITDTVSIKDTIQGKHIKSCVCESGILKWQTDDKYLEIYNIRYYFFGFNNILAFNKILGKPLF